MSETADKKSQASDLSVLHPDRTLQIGTPPRDVTVEEFRFLDGIVAQRIARPIIDHMASLFGDTDPDKVSLEDLQELFAEHQDAFVELMSMSAKVDAGFIASLSDTDGQMLLNTFWQVNALFFVRRLLQNLRGRYRAGETTKANAGDESTQP